MAKALMESSELLKGNNTIPGVKVPDEIFKEIPGILKACKDFGLDFYPTVVEFLDYEGISEVAAYGGFPVRYPHWGFGEQFVELSRGYEFGAHRIYEMVINCCFSETQVVTREYGSKKIKDIKVGEHVLASKGWRKIVAMKEQPESQTYKLNLKEFYPKTVCTPNHKWMCLRNGYPKWVETKDIVPGDMILAGAEFNLFTKKPAIINWTPDNVINETASNVRNRLLPINPPTQMTLELAELMGVLSGDGSSGVQRASSTISVCVHKSLEDYQNHVADLMTTVFGREAVIYKKPKSVNTIVLCSKFAVDYLNFVGFKKGCTYKTKRVPQSIWQSSNEYRAAYLRGLFDTDGYCGKYLSMSCYSDELASDVQLLLLEMGIRSKYRRVQNKNNDIAVISIKGKSNIRLFQKLIGFSLSYKAERLATLADTISGSGGHGQKLIGFMKRIFERIDCIEKQPNWMYRFRRYDVNKELSSNAYYHFLNKAVTSGYEEYFSDLLAIAQTPIYEVESISEDDVQKTYDIALDHEEHDFLANGLVSHNTNPCYIYCLDSNTFVDNVTVIAHATGHNDFFKNNIFFAKTSQNMMNELANHGTRIRRYMSEWGKEEVGRYIDKIMSIDTLIDPANAWVKRRRREPIPEVRRKFNHPRRIKIDKDHEHMEDWINTKEYIDSEKERIKEEELQATIGLFQGADKDIFGYLKDHAPMKPWQQDVMSMLYNEAMYFSPQGMTKTLNEGWASLTDSEIMARFGLAKDAGIVEYAVHKAGVLGGKTSMNPYKLGYTLLCDIEERWNKGKFGREYDECEDAYEKAHWDKKLGLGHDKVFEVREFYDDVTFISEFFTQEFCNDNEFFIWRRFPDGTYKIMERDANKIKKMLLQRFVNRGLPILKLVEPNYKNRRIFLIEHEWDGRTLHPGQTSETMKALSFLWKGPCAVLTKDKDSKQIMYYCEDGKVEVGEPNI